MGPSDSAGRACPRGVRPAVAGAALALVAGCSTGDGRASGPESQPRPRPGPDTTAAAPSRTPTPQPPQVRPPAIRIALAGDVHFEGALAARLADPATALGPASAALAAADLSVLNLESSVGAGGRPEPGKRFTFSAGPEAFAALAAAGVDVAVQANNHALDFGRARVRSTLQAARRAAAGDPPLAVVGIGADEDEAFTPALTSVDGTMVATIAASLADQDPTADPTGPWAARAGRAGIADANDPRRLLREVRRVARDADVVVVYLHWGVQGEQCPSARQRDLAARLVTAGADVVAGSHAHVLQGDGRLGEGYVAYGLGNFAWYSPGRTGVLTLTVRAPRDADVRARVTRARWWPAQIGTDGLASPLRGDAAADFRADREALRACAGLG